MLILGHKRFKTIRSALNTQLWSYRYERPAGVMARLILCSSEKDENKKVGYINCKKIYV